LTHAAAVRVPASTSNLGSGFDALGLAARRYLSARYQPGAGELSLTREGTLAGLQLDPSNDLLLTTFVAELERRGEHRVGGALSVSSEIPVGRGLGASAAAVVAGLMLAAAASGDLDPDREQMLAQAARAEGHGDNAGPSLFGGLVGIAPGGSFGVRAFPLPLSSEVAFVYAAPPVLVSTAAARAALPAEYSRPTAIGALARVVSLLHGLATGDGEALAVGLEDQLHVPYRLGLIPGGAMVLEAATRAGAWGATISGSGSGLLAVCPPDAAARVTESMARAFRAAGQNPVIAFQLEPDREGAQLMRGGEPARAAREAG
jgi:homoserine kinase